MIAQHFEVAEKIGFANRQVIEEPLPGGVGRRVAVERAQVRLVVGEAEIARRRPQAVGKVIGLLGRDKQAESLGKIAKEIMKMSELSQKVLGQAVSSLVDLDTKKANESISLTKKVIEMDEKMTSELLRPGLEPNTVGWFRLVLESVRRVAEYGSDIAEIAVDLTAKEPNHLG